MTLVNRICVNVQHILNDFIRQHVVAEDVVYDGKNRSVAVRFLKYKGFLHFSLYHCYDVPLFD